VAQPVRGEPDQVLLEDRSVQPRSTRRPVPQDPPRGAVKTRSSSPLPAISASISSRRNSGIATARPFLAFGVDQTSPPLIAVTERWTHSRERSRSTLQPSAQPARPHSIPVGGY
jgi:hypothetical protein